MMKLLGILFNAAVATALVVERQASSSPASAASQLTSRPSNPFSTSFQLFPTGPRNYAGALESGVPLACLAGCYDVLNGYYACFINTTYQNGAKSDPEVCNSFNCDQGRYDQLKTCLNCIIANGDERPYGYYTNTALTTQGTALGRGNLTVQVNPNGLVDVDQANGWLKNVTEKCSGIGKAVTGETTLTASPTTTGPYYTSWDVSATVDLPTWTGLTQYTAEPTRLLTAGAEVAPTAGPVAASSGSQTASSSSPAAAASSTGASPRRAETGVFWAAASGLLMYFVV